MMKTKRKLIVKVHKDIETIPIFIRTTSEQHRIIWSYMQDIISNLSRLLVDRIVPERVVRNIVNNLNYLVFNCGEISKDNGFEIMIATWIQNHINEYESIALEEEEYEVLENLKKLNDILSEL
jgi:hypothetical protein